MLDTIHLVIHGREKYKDILRFLWETCEKNKSYTRSAHWISDSESQGFMDQERLLEKISYKGTRSILVNGKYFKRAKSSHYNVVWSESIGRDTIECNVSIPKYLFGHNIAQFVVHPWERDWRWSFTDYKENLDSLSTRLANFLEFFFDKELPQFEVRKKDIEIRRLDFCFNMLMKDKDDALTYMSMIRKNMRRRTKVQEFANMGMFVKSKSMGYSLKIYHKGSEYEKHDKKEHRRINDEFVKRYEISEREIVDMSTGEIKKSLNSDKGVFDTDWLQWMSDRTVRFEAMFRNTYMSDIYNRYLLRKKDRKHKVETQDYRELYNSCMETTYEDPELFKKRLDIENKLSDFDRKLKPSTLWLKYHGTRKGYAPQRLGKHFNPTKLDRSDKLFFRKKEEEQKKVRRFHWAVDREVKDHLSRHDGTYAVKYDEAPFSKELVVLLAKRFWSFVKDCEVRTMPAEDKIHQAIVEHNRKVVEKKEWYSRWPPRNEKEKKELKGLKQFQPNRIMALYYTLKQRNFKTMYEEKTFPESTMRRYRKEFRELGIELEQLGEIDIRTDFSFHDYYHLCHDPKFEQKLFSGMSRPFHFGTKRAA